MTETEWLACNHPSQMSWFVRRNHATDRKLRLFAVARCRHFLHEIQGKGYRRAVEVAEQYADGFAKESDLIDATNDTFRDDRSGFKHKDWVCGGYAQFACELPGGDLCGHMFAFKPPYPAHDAKLIHDIFGNPFRPVAIEPGWLTSTVVALAEGIYADRAFDRMLILGDALQDAGCDNDDILNHCRDANGVHVRGCWIVDLLLGKK